MPAIFKGGEMSETKELVAFLDDLIILDTEDARNWGTDKDNSFQVYVAMLTEIKEKILRLEWHETELQRAHEIVARMRDKNE